MDPAIAVKEPKREAGERQEIPETDLPDLAVDYGVTSPFLILRCQAS